MDSSWIDKVIEFHIGKEPLLFIAPHEGVELVEAEVEGEKRVVQIGERGTGYLAKLAAREVNGSYIVIHAPRLQADFARDPSLLGKGEKFRQNLDGKKIWFESHKNTSYKLPIEKFHKLVGKINPKFIVDIHTMGSDRAHVKLGFGKDRRYINGSENALRFRDTLMEKSQLDLKVQVSKVELTGESEFILNRYEEGRLAMLVEFSNPLGFKIENGEIDKRYQTLMKHIALLTKEWIK